MSVRHRLCRSVSSQIVWTGVILGIVSGCAWLSSGRTNNDVAELIRSIPTPSDDPSVAPRKESSALADSAAVVLGEEQSGPAENGSDIKKQDTSDSRTTEELQGDEHYVCTVRDYNFNVNSSEIAAFNPTADIVWPGSLVQGASLANGLPAAIPVRAAPIVLTITTVRDTLDASVSVRNPSAPSLANAVNRLAQRVPQATPAKLSYSSTRMYSLEQSMLALNLSASWLGGNVRAQFRNAASSEQTTIVAKFTQEYYTVFATPVRASNYIHSTVRVAQIRPYVAPGNPPVRIASVTYGRMLLFKFSSDRSAESVEAAVQFAQRFTGGRVDAAARQEALRRLEGISIEYAALGGAAADAITAISADDFIGLLEAGANASAKSPGVPISYTTRYLKNERVATVNLTTEYSVKDCELGHRTLLVRFIRLRIVNDCDSFSDGQGDFTWHFRAQGETVEERRQQINLGGGHQHALSGQRTYTIPRRRGERFELTGEVRDHDGVSSGGDDVMPFSHVMIYDSPTWILGTHTKRIAHNPGSCDADVTFSVDEIG